MESKWILALAILSIVGLCSANNICDTAECESPINVSVGEEFGFSYESNRLSTGYEWWTDFDTNYVTLTNNTLVPGEGIDAPEYRVFIFSAKETGETYIRMLELRPWVNGTVAASEIYPIVITSANESV